MKKTNNRRAAFPKFTKQGKTGNIGIETVTSIVNNELNWLFRRVHQEEDFGIDGHMDIVLDDGSVSGRSIAMQIKTGSSFLKRATTAGFVFYGEAKHLNYYLNHQLPVLIILCDPDSHVCYFEVFDINKTEKTSTGWRTIIPSVQTLGIEAKQKLLTLVGPVIDHTADLEEHWAFTNLMGAMSRILFAVEREDIESQNTKKLTDFIERISANVFLAEKLQGKIDITISGYNSDPRELWEIEAVRDWFKIAHTRVKYWFYFLCTDDKAAGLKVLFACFCGLETSEKKDAKGRKQTVFDALRLSNFMEANWPYLNEMIERTGMPDDVNKKITFDIMEMMYGKDMVEPLRKKYSAG